MTVQKRQSQRRSTKNTRVEGGQRFRPDRRELLHAMESLYKDQLKPVSRTLRRRIGEWASGVKTEELYGATDSGFQDLPNIDLANLQSMCRGCSCIQVQMEEGGDWSAVFKDRPQVFVDIYNPRDPFSDTFWENTSNYFEGLSGSNMFFPGTRYACAQALVGRKVQFLLSYTLGQVCHMVEIAISRRKLLGYCNDAIVPYRHSLSMRKEQCAEQQRRCTPVGSRSTPMGSCTTDVGGGSQASPMLPPATLEVARRYLHEILKANRMVPLSNIKRIFRTQYHTELSETLLGHSRLSDLLQDVRFRDLCTVQLQQNGYVVIAQTGLQEMPMLATTPRFELAALIPSPVPSPVAVLPTPSPSLGVPQSAQVQKWSSWHSNFQKEAAASYHQQMQLCSEESSWGRHLANNINYMPQSQPQHGRDEFYGLSFEPAGGKPPVDAGPVTISLSLATPLPSPGVPTSAAMRRWSDKPRCSQFCKDEPLCLAPTPMASPGVPGSAVTRRWAESSQQSSLTRSGSSDSTISGDTSLLSLPCEPSIISIQQGLLAGPTDDINQNASEDSLQLFDGSTQLLHATGFSTSFADSRKQPEKEKGPRTPRGSPPGADVTNRQTTADTCFAEKVSVPASALRKWKDVVVVHNTFIHAKMPPPTPIDHRHRSNSVPKDAYSSMGDASATISDVKVSERQCNLGSWSPMTYRRSVIPQCQDDVGLGLRPRFSPQLGSEIRTPALEVDVFPHKDMVSPKVSFDLQPTSLSAQVGRLGLTIQNSFVHTAPVPLVPSSDRGKRSSSAPPKLYRAAASSCCIGDALPLDLVSSVGRTPPPSGCEATTQTEEKEAMAVKDHAIAAHAISDDAPAAKAEADGPQPPTQRRIVRSAKLLELMPPCCRTLFHSATAPESTLRAV